MRPPRTRPLLLFIIVAAFALLSEAARVNLNRYDAIEHKQLGGADLTEEAGLGPNQHVAQLKGLDGLNNPNGTPKTEQDRFTFGDMTAFAGDFLGPSRHQDVLCMGKTQGGGDTVKARFDRLKQKMKSMQPGYFQTFNRMWGMRTLASYGMVSDGPTHSYKQQIAAERKAIAPLGQDFGGFRNGLDAAIESTQAGGVGMLTSRDNVQSTPKSGVSDKLLGDSVLGMLSFNDDHFGQCAQLTVESVLRSWPFNYATPPPVDAAQGQERSVIREVVGTPLTDEQRLEAAIMSHFWTDQLAGGHVRTPRHALRKLCDGMVGGLMTNTMHNEDNKNGVPITVSLPFRDPNNRQNIVLQRQKLTVKGDANYWTEGNQAKNRFAGYWRYVDQEMMAHVNLAHVTPKWDRANDEQTCPMFYVDGEYDHDNTGSFNFDGPGKEVKMRLHMWPQACGQEDLINVAVFAGAGSVTSLQLNTKCCYMTTFRKQWCNGIVSTAYDQKHATQSYPSNKNGVFTAAWETVLVTRTVTDSEGDSREETERRSRKKDTASEVSAAEKTFVSRYWNYVMLHVREWNFLYRPGGSHNKLPVNENTVDQLRDLLRESGYPDTTVTPPGNNNN